MREGPAEPQVETRFGEATNADPPGQRPPHRSVFGGETSFGTVKELFSLAVLLSKAPQPLPCNAHSLVWSPSLSVKGFRMNVITLHKIITCHAIRLSLFGFEDTSCHVVSCSMEMITQ